MHILTSALNEVDAVRREYLGKLINPQESDKNDGSLTDDLVEQDNDDGFPERGPNENNQEEPDTHHPVVHVIYRDRNPRLPDPHVENSWDYLTFHEETTKTLKMYWKRNQIPIPSQH